MVAAAAAVSVCAEEQDQEASRGISRLYTGEVIFEVLKVTSEVIRYCSLDIVLL